jgi:hypothetical protein
VAHVSTKAILADFTFQEEMDENTFEETETAVELK